MQHQEVLALKAQKRAAERNTLPNIAWNDEHQVSSVTANKLRLYLNQRHLQVSGGKAALIARDLRYVRAGQDPLETEVNDTTSDSGLQSSDSNRRTRQLRRRCAIRLFGNGRIFRRAFNMRYCLSQTLMSNALQYKASSEKSGIFKLLLQM